LDIPGEKRDVTIRTRSFLVYLVLVGGGLIFVVNQILSQVRPRYLESMEESLVDTANLLATTVETRAVHAAAIDTAEVHAMLDPAYRRELSAKIYTLEKKTIDLRVYVTDAEGKVIYDSDGGRAEGADYSRWLDVSRTLRGGYGARGTRVLPNDDASLVIYVAAPIRADGRTIGVLTVGKPTKNINELVAAAQRRILIAGMIGGGLIVFTGFAFSVWLTTPIARLTAYARAVRDGRPATLPRLAGREVADLRKAFEEMRAALEGKQYIEHYTQALTHEIKAPLSAIRGAAELLSESMPAEERARFLDNIRREAERIQHLIDQLLQLAALEGRRDLGPTQLVPLAPLVDEIADSLSTLIAAKSVVLENRVAGENLRVRAEPFLLRLALTNLLKNAIEFSPVGGRIFVTGKIEHGRVRMAVEDQGPGIPDFARERIFERFYSLPRPGTGVKSTGLGLSFVQEIAHLHGGKIQIENRAEGGCRAELAI
jgi:two-component system sensor histidine kinase CreC